MNQEQRARLKELRAKNTRTAEEEQELTTLQNLALDEIENTDPPADPPADPASSDPAPVETTSVAASMPAVPAGVPGPTSSTSAVSRPRSLHQVIADLTAALKPGNENTVGSITERPTEVRAGASLLDALGALEAGYAAVPVLSEDGTSLEGWLTHRQVLVAQRRAALAAADPFIVDPRQGGTR